MDYEAWRRFLAEADAPDGYVSRACRVARTNETAGLAIDPCGLPGPQASPLDVIYSSPSPTPGARPLRGRTRSSPEKNPGPSVPSGRGST